MARTWTYHEHSRGYTTTRCSGSGQPVPTNEACRWMGADVAICYDCGQQTRIAEGK